MLVKTSGEWRPTLEWYGKTSGEHRSVRNLYKKVSGSWEEIELYRLPHSSNLSCNWQIDYGISANGDDELQYWDDREDANRLQLAGGDHPVLMDDANKLMGLPSVKMYKSGTIFHQLVASDYWFTAPTYAVDRKYTIALLYKRTPSTDGDIVLSPQPGSTYMSGIQGWILEIYTNGDVKVERTSTSGTEKWTPSAALWEGVAVTAKWNVYIFRVDFPAMTIDLWVNGIKQTQKEFTRMDFFSNVGTWPKGMLGHTQYGLGNSGNYAAILGWNNDVVFNDEDYIMAYHYLANKYGLI